MKGFLLAMALLGGACYFSIPAMIVMKDGEVLGQIQARSHAAILEEFRDFF